MSKHQDRHGNPVSVGRRIAGAFPGHTWETGTAPMHQELDKDSHDAWPAPRPKPDIAVKQSLTDRIMGRK